MDRIKRVIRPGRMTTTSPKVVRCTWTVIDTEKLATENAAMDQISSSRGCWMHKGCKGHLTVDEDIGTYLIPYGYAAGDELVQSDGFVVNKMVLSGDKGMSDVADFCFRRLSGKKGILRKACNGTRPTNSIRLLLSPPSDGMEWGTVDFPKQVADKDSALPVKVRITDEDTLSVRIPLETCKLNNADFNSDKGWFILPATDAFIAELESHWKRVWYSSGMSTHGGGEMYDSLMLKQRSWKAMYATMKSTPYWASFVERSKAGKVNTIMGRFGVAGPYGAIRMGMMLGTTVSTTNSMFTVASPSAPLLPIVAVPPGTSPVLCSSAMTKLTKIMYQSGINTSKHDSKRTVQECEEYDKFAELHNRDNSEITPFSREWVTKHTGNGIDSSIVMARLLFCPNCNDGVDGKGYHARIGHLSRMVDKNTSDLAGSFVLQGLDGADIMRWGKRRPSDIGATHERTSSELLEVMNIPINSEASRSMASSASNRNRNALNSIHELTATSEIPPIEALPSAVTANVGRS
ncbi:uncharacterized protein PpBr36_11067 [Pyricularia pennisetigena]|uniref:uncharacterized protein n=1 Tax=Pyricularia pennisetigena TaxID=1578925 RepID=UPI0011523688|nr:uncharacterized protein PpBr36_11067 [Pyricularia pennisetigena]TLS20634.1 hypothetical protein PpBr36_11067 [Pyricularia pennisetigena]